MTAEMNVNANAEMSANMTAEMTTDPRGELPMTAEMKVNASVEMNDEMKADPGGGRQLHAEMNVEMTTADAEMHAERQSYPWARMTPFCCTTGVVTPGKHGQYRHTGIFRVSGG